jgi:hypothetical protein
MPLISQELFFSDAYLRVVKATCCRCWCAIPRTSKGSVNRPWPPHWAPFRYHSSRQRCPCLPRSRTPSTRNGTLYGRSAHDHHQGLLMIALGFSMPILLTTDTCVQRRPAPIQMAEQGDHRRSGLHESCPPASKQGKGQGGGTAPDPSRGRFAPT